MNKKRKLLWIHSGLVLIWMGLTSSLLYLIDDFWIEILILIIYITILFQLGGVVDWIDKKWMKQNV